MCQSSHTSHIKELHSAGKTKRAPEHAVRDKQNHWGRCMHPVSKRIVKTVLWGVAALALIACGVLIKLVYVGSPDTATSLEFQGFVRFPRGAMLTVLDYLTVDDQHLFVADESTGNVYKIDLRGKTLPQSTDVTVFASEPAAHGVVLDPSKQLAYVTRSEVNTVDVFNSHTMQKVARIPVADDPDAILFDSFHNIVYVANGDSNLATLIDPQTLTVTSTIPLGGKPEFVAFDSQTKLIYQNLKDINSVAAVDVAARSVIERWPLQGCTAPSGMAIDAAQRRLFIACSANAMLAIFDLSAHRVTSLVPIGGGPDSVAFDPELHRIYAAGKSGVLTVIRQDTPDAYHVLDSIKLHYGAHTLTVDPARHTLYVAYASLLVPSRVAVFVPR
jgi:YVTN family beta-propeller protein